MSNLGRLVWSAREGEGRVKLSSAWVRDADWVEHMDALKDWMADLEAIYNARLAGMPDWHMKTWNDRPAIDAALAAKYTSNSSASEK